MFENRTRVLLILPEEVLERARVLAGRETVRLKLAVSLQIVLRALIEEGLKRADDRTLLANVESQAWAVRRLRSLAGRRGSTGAGRRTSRVRTADAVIARRVSEAGDQTLSVKHTQKEAQARKKRRRA